MTHQFILPRQIRPENPEFLWAQKQLSKFFWIAPSPSEAGAAGLPWLSPVVGSTLVLGAAR
jgi:hypothetical protein